MTSFFILQKAEATGEKRPRGRPRKWVSNKIKFVFFFVMKNFWVLVVVVNLFLFNWRIIAFNIVLISTIT